MEKFYNNSRSSSSSIRHRYRYNKNTDDDAILIHIFLRCFSILSKQKQESLPDKYQSQTGAVQFYFMGFSKRNIIILVFAIYFQDVVLMKFFFFRILVLSILLHAYNRLSFKKRTSLIVLTKAEKISLKRASLKFKPSL